MRPLRWAAGIGGGLAAVILGGGIALGVAIERGAFTPRILAAVEQATGRAATLGALSLRPGFAPRIVAEGATLANLPGGSRPEMARIRRLEASLRLVPLLWGEVAIGRVAIDGADILLERLPDGAPNWTLRPAARPAAPDAPGAPRPAAARRPVTIGEVVLTDSRVTLPDARLGTLAVPRARILGIGGAGPVTLAGEVALLGLQVQVEAEGAPAGGALRAALAIGRNRVSAEGQPGQEVRLAATLPEPAALRPLLEAFAQGLPAPQVLPPLEAMARLGPDLQPREAVVRLGAADVSAMVPGLVLAGAEIRADGPDEPARATIEGSKGGLPLRAAITIATPGALLADRPVEVSAEASAGTATARLTGRIDSPHRLSGGAAELRLAVPDLGALAALLPNPPPLTEMTLEARLAAPGRLAEELRIAAFRIESRQLESEGELVLRPGSPLGIDGRIAVARADLDALGRRAAAAAPAAPPQAAPPPAPAANGRVIPDIPLPLAAVRAYRGRLGLSADQVIIGGTAWRQVRATLALADGTARLAPFAAVTPGGPVQGEAMLDAAAAPPRLEVALRSEGLGLDLAAIRRARQEPASLHGRAEIRIELRGHGATTRAVAATLAGEAGLALVEGRVDRAGMLRLGPDLLGLLLPGAPQDGLELRCLALRISAEDGLARTQALLAETSAGRIEGVAAVNLRSEALAARLLPDITMFGVRVRAPVGIGGTIAAPRIGVEPGRALTQVIEDTVANRLWRDPTVEWLRGRVAGGAPAGDCAAQLRLARFGADGPVPATERIVPGVPRELQGTTQDLLRGLGGILGGRR